MNKALVSIGVPVYNEGKYICDTIESVLSQTYSNIELIISDNCSTDDTVKKVREMQDKFPEVGLVVHDKNIGAIQNFNFVKKEAKGKYFMWLGGHDIIMPTYIEKCLTLFEENKELILVYSKAKFFSENVENVNSIDASVDLKTLGLDSVDRAMKVLNPDLCTAIHGVFHAEKFKNNFLQQMPIAPDNVFLFELALEGEFDEVDDYLYFRREVRKKETISEQSERYKELYMIQSDAPHDELKYQHFKAIQRSSLGLKQSILLRVKLFDVFLNEFSKKSELLKRLLIASRSAKDRVMFRKIAIQHYFIKLRYRIIK